jgi:hypothetical protein
MRGFVQGTDRQQTTLLPEQPECLEDLPDEGMPHMLIQGPVHNVERAPHQTLGIRTRRRSGADAAR